MDLENEIGDPCRATDRAFKEAITVIRRPDVDVEGADGALRSSMR